MSSHQDASAPHAYPKRILLAVTGLSPQVVTETLYALAVRQSPPFIPTEVHVITTSDGAERARLTLLSRDPGWFHRLCREYRLTGIDFRPDTIHTLCDDAGVALTDIRTPTDNEHAADFITERVRLLTQDPSVALHVSIAGGRKTMGFYLGYALSLYGRLQDRLSHVLVSAPFESHPDFFYPTQQSRVIYANDKTQTPLDTRNATVTLAEIPFVRLREGQPERLLVGQVRFSEAVAAANRAYAAPRLILRTTERSASADGERLNLGPTEFAVLLWLAERVLREEAEVAWNEATAAEEFLAVARRVFNPMGGEYERLDNAVTWRKNSSKDLADYFEPQKSRINDSMAQTLGSYVAKRYTICRLGRKGESRYHLPLPPEAISIEP